MIDIVYTLGSFSKWNNNELRYSLRSVAAHLSGVRNVIVIGEKPAFLTNAIHIPFADCYYKERNIMEKLLYISKQDFVSDNFLFFNDDHFLLNEMSADRFPFYHNGTLAEAIHKRPNDIYRSILSKTYKALNNDGLSTLHFDIHTPIIYNKKYFREIMSRYDWSMAYGYAIKSLYANNLETQGQFLEDCKINFPGLFQNIKLLLKERTVFSVGDNGLNDAMKFFLEECYPFKSCYEL